MNTGIEAGLIALVDQDAHLEPARNQVESAVAIETGQRFHEQSIEVADIARCVGEAVNQLGQVEAAAEPIEVIVQIGEGLLCFGLGNDVQISASGEEEADLRQWLEMAGQLAARAAQALGHGFDPTQLRREEDADFIGLAEAALAQDDGVGAVDAGGRHQCGSPGWGGAYRGSKPRCTASHDLAPAAQPEACNYAKPFSFAESWEPWDKFPKPHEKDQQHWATK